MASTFTSYSLCKRLLRHHLPRLILYQRPLTREINVEHVIPRLHDLHLLFLSDAQINSLRGNRPFAYGKPIFLPPTGSEGIVARALLYYENQYRRDLEEWIPRRTCMEWLEQYPACPLERARNIAIAQWQGAPNPWIEPRG